LRTHTIVQPEWRKTFDSLSRIYIGSTATLEVLTPDLGAQMEIEEEPLTGLTYDKSGIELSFVTKGGHHLTHLVSHPKRVQFEEGEDGILSAVEIESDDDPKLVLRLHPPDPRKLLPSDQAGPRSQD
jgi:hypothetical protein